MSVFTVEGLPGLTFTAEFDPDLDWLTISGRNTDDELVSKTGISVTPDVVEDVPITPEPIIPDGGTEATAAHIESFAPPEPEPDPEPQPEPEVV